MNKLRVWEKKKLSSSCWVTRWIARAGLWIEQKIGRPFWLFPWWQAISRQNSFTLWGPCGGMTVLNDVPYKLKVISVVTGACLDFACGSAVGTPIALGIGSHFVSMSLSISSFAVHLCDLSKIGSFWRGCEASWGMCNLFAYDVSYWSSSNSRWMGLERKLPNQRKICSSQVRFSEYFP